MKISIYLLLPLFLTLPLAAQQSPYDFSEVDRVLQDSLSVSGGLNRGYALILIKDGMVIYDSAFGNNYSLQRVVPIASATKWLSGSVIMALVDEGLISLDDTVGNWFPEAPAAKREITIRQLFSLTAGFPGEAAYYNDRTMTLATAVDSILERVDLVIPPGSGFLYAGSSMQVAGRIAELATGKPWDTVFAERIARPLGMSSTDYEGLGETDNPQIAGGAQSSALDYARFLRMIASGGRAENGTQVLSEEAVATMLADQTDGAPIIYSPYTAYGYIDSLIPNSRYGIGLWRETSAFDTAASPDLTSPGACGFGPWYDPDRNLVGVFSVLSLQQQTAPTYFRIKRLVIEAIDQKAVSVEEDGDGDREERIDLE